MLACSLLDKLFLQNPPPIGGWFFFFSCKTAGEKVDNPARLLYHIFCIAMLIFPGRLRLSGVDTEAAD